jgi:DNA-binding NarL/FixJ family response regulator
LVARFLAATTNLLQRSETAGRGDISMLSAREDQVAKAVAAGLSNKEVASRLNISERTVKAHLGAVFEKLEVRDRLQLVLFLSAGARTSRKAGAEDGDA